MSGSIKNKLHPAKAYFSKISQLPENDKLFRKQENQTSIEMGYIRISGEKGDFHFICVDGQMDIRNAEKNNFKFSWDGSDECDPASGLGDFVYKDDILIGRIYFHMAMIAHFLQKIES